MEIFGFKLKIRQQLIVLFMIFAVVPSALITGITITSNGSTVSNAKNDLTKLQVEGLTGLAYQYADIVDNWVQEESRNVEVISSDPIVRIGIEEIVNRNDISGQLAIFNELFTNWIENSDVITEIILLNYTTGDVILSKSAYGYDNTTNNKINDPYFLGAKTTQKDSILTDQVYYKQIYYSTTTKSYNMAFSHVIRPHSSNTADPLAIVVTRVNPQFLWDLLSPRESNSPIESFYKNIGLGNTGEIYLINGAGLAISPSRFIQNDNDFILKQDYSQISNIQNARANGIDTGVGSSYRNQKVYGIYLYLGLNPSSTDKRSAYVKNAIDFNLDWVIAIEISQNEVLIPVINIQNQLNQSLLFILSVIALVGISVVLVSIFIASSFSKPIRNLSTISQSIASGDLTTKIEESKKTDEIGELQSAFVTMIDFLRPSILSISGVAKTLAGSAQEMASSSEEVNASSEEMSSVSQQISKGAQQQSEYLNQSLKQVNDIQRQFSDKIAGIKIASELIESISSQVNMLALNASIEAARAGEYGRGFAVVADNIRRLADEAKSSVDRVNQIIGDLTITVTSGMDSLSKSVINVTTVAEETASGAEEASAATEEQAATMQELSASAQELAKISSDLEEIVSRFKL